MGTTKPNLKTRWPGRSRLAIFSTCAWLLACGPSQVGGSSGADAGTDGGATVDAPDDQCVGGTLCGQPATCCPAGSECIDGACLTACASGVRCGSALDVCCASGEVCLAETCALPGDNCQDSYDCQPGQFCEPTLTQCLPQPDPLTCEYVPSFEQLDVTVEWMFDSDQIISIPVVGDLDGDYIPEVVVNVTQQEPNSWPAGNIVVLDGQSGTELLRIPHNPGADQYGSHGRSSIAIGDVTGDDIPDIIYGARPDADGKGLIVAVDAAGALLWTSRDPSGLDHRIFVENAAVTLANFDSDPAAEIAIGATLIDNDGLVVWDQDGNGGIYGSNEGYAGGVSAVADLDGDLVPEIVSGRHAWKVDWQPGPTVVVTNYWTYPGDDGYPAVVDLDGDGEPEVVLAANAQLMALDGQTGELFCGVDPTDAACQADPAMRTPPLPIPGATVANNRGGPPTVADFDADGRPEVGIAGGYSYTVYDLNRTDENIVQPAGDPVPQPGALFRIWSRDTQDISSNATGSSVFDFQGDGAAEVVYADECFMRVYSGTDGTVQLELANSSATIHEYPLVVDVDADGNSEILIVANEKACPGATPRHGLYVYGDANDEWVPTRRVWTQHTYHVSNATSDGNVPFVESDNWTTPGLNNYRQNVQGDGVFNAPDLTVDLSVGLDQCSLGNIVLLARVSNLGALGVPPGAEVYFYEGTDASGALLGTGATTAPLLPGASTTVELAVPAPAAPTDYFVVTDSTTATSVAECDDQNNTDLTTQASCTIIE